MDFFVCCAGIWPFGRASKWRRRESIFEFYFCFGWWTSGDVRDGWEGGGAGPAHSAQGVVVIGTRRLFVHGS